MIILSILFFGTAILYASVGFGGGSTYLALLLLWGIPYYIFPVIALMCNIFVVSGNSFNYIRAGNLNLKLLIPYLIGSIPLAYIGGSLQIFLSTRLWLALFILCAKMFPDLSVFKVLVSVTVNNAIFTLIKFKWLYYQFYLL